MQKIKTNNNWTKNKKILFFLILLLFTIFIIFSWHKKISVTSIPQLSSLPIPSTTNLINNTLTSLTSPSLENIKESFIQIPIYIGDQPNFPTNLPSLKITTSENQSLIKQLNNLCQINTYKENFSYGNLCNYYYFDQNSYVSLNREAEQLSAEDEFDFVNINQIQTQVSSFLKEIISDFFQNYILADVKYYEGIGEYTATDSPQNAQLVEFEYNLVYQNIPIFTKESSLPHLSILSSSKNILQKGIFPTRNFLITTEKDSFDLITLDQALKNISLNHGYLLQIGPLDENSDSLSNSPAFTEIIFDKIALEYRYDETYQLAVPSYHFSGKGLDTNGNSLTIEIVTPAIKIK